MAELLVEAYSKTRKVQLCGHAPEEERNPQFPGTFQSNILMNEEKNKKVYPNDPCPCGSGKKYKKVLWKELRERWWCISFSENKC